MCFEQGVSTIIVFNLMPLVIYICIWNNLTEQRTPNILPNNQHDKCMILSCEVEQRISTITVVNLVLLVIQSWIIFRFE